MADEYDEVDDQTTPTKLDKSKQIPKDQTTKSAPRGKHDDRELRPQLDEDDKPENTFRGGESHYPPSWTMFEKMSKEDAEYRQGMPFHNCGKCQYYQGNICKVVRGYIVQSMGCKYFQEKYSPVSFGVPLRVRISK